MIINMCCLHSLIAGRVISFRPTEVSVPLPVFARTIGGRCEPQMPSDASGVPNGNISMQRDPTKMLAC